MAMDAPAGDKKVTLVHHNNLLREGVCRVLADGGFEVVWHGADGSELVGRLPNCRPDLMVLEWEAPGVSASLV
jgi:chemotaxis response regulator CheB